MIYFIQEAENVAAPIKIGFTQVGADSRLKDLQVANARALAVLATAAGTVVEEEQQHQRWAHLRMEGEWFRADAELRKHIFSLRNYDPEKPMWFDLVALEPRLLELLQRAEAIRDDGGETFCANHRWYGCGSDPCEKCGGGLKSVLVDLVGWSAGDAALQADRAYDVAYKKVYAALPGCRQCTCF